MTKEKAPDGEESIFEGAEVTEEIPQNINEAPEDGEQTEFNPTVSKESEKEKLERKGQRYNVDGKTLTIKTHFWTRPKNKDQDGNPIEPKLTLKNKKPFYPGKLGIRFEEDNLVEYYPNIKYFVNEGVMSQNVKLPKTGPKGKESEVTKLVQLVIAKIGKPSDEVSDKEILDYLPGKKVKIKTASGDYNGPWFRNDIEKFVD